MNATAPRLTILPGNTVRLADGRTGTVDELQGSTATVELPKARSSRTAIIRSYEDLFEPCLCGAAHGAGVAGEGPTVPRCDIGDRRKNV